MAGPVGATLLERRHPFVVRPRRPKGSPVGSRDIPQWLVPAYVRSVRAVGAQAGTDEIRSAGRDLLERWASPERHFHGVRHLKDTLARADELAPETHHPDIVRLAVWYHGAVFSTSAHQAYRRAAGEDTDASAQFAIDHLTALGVSRAVAERVAFLILNLKRHDADPADIDAQALSDADLGTVAAEPQKYRSYRTLVAQEFAHIPRRHYLEARVRIVTGLLERRRLFRSPLAQAWEQQARENLTAELAQLRAELTAMGDPDAEGHLPTSPDHERQDAARAAPKAARAAPRERVPDPDAGDTTGTLTRVRPTGPLDIPSEGSIPRAGTPAGRGGAHPAGRAPTAPLADAPREDGSGPSDVDLRSSLEADPEEFFASLDTDAQRRPLRRPAPAAHDGEREDARQDEGEDPPQDAKTSDAVTSDADPGERTDRGATSGRHDEHLSGIEREPDLSTGRRRAHR